MRIKIKPRVWNEKDMKDSWINIIYLEPGKIFGVELKEDRIEILKEIVDECQNCGRTSLHNFLGLSENSTRRRFIADYECDICKGKTRYTLDNVRYYDAVINRLMCEGEIPIKERW